MLYSEGWGIQQENWLNCNVTALLEWLTALLEYNNFDFKSDNGHGFHENCT